MTIYCLFNPVGILPDDWVLGAVGVPEESPLADHVIGIAHALEWEVAAEMLRRTGLTVRPCYPLHQCEAWRTDTYDRRPVSAIIDSAQVVLSTQLAFVAAWTDMARALSDWLTEHATPADVMWRLSIAAETATRGIDPSGSVWEHLVADGRPEFGFGSDATRYGLECAAAASKLVDRWEALQ